MRSPPVLCFCWQLSSETFSAETFSAETFSAETFSAAFVPQLCMERLIFFLRYLFGFSALPVIS